VGRRKQLYTTLLGLTHNPFPDHAIAAGGDRWPFDSDLHVGMPDRFARIFLGPRVDPTRKLTFFWSLGDGEEARGYGKTAYLLWFTQAICQDLGREMLRRCGGDPSRDCILAAYSSFNAVEGLSLSNVLYDAALDLLGARHSIIEALRGDKLARGATAYELLDKASAISWAANFDTNSRLLSELACRGPSSAALYLRSLSQWHRVRWGSSVLGTTVAFLKAIGVTRMVLVIDQIEDFANWLTPSYKLQRDLPRLANICMQDRLLADCLQIVVTIHPRAQRVLDHYSWNNLGLGDLTHDPRSERCIVLVGLTPDQFVRLTMRYLDSARAAGTQGGFSPFDRQTLDLVCTLQRGRPGPGLQVLHRLVEEAIDAGLAEITLNWARQFLG